MCAIDRRPVHAACMCMHTASMCSHPHQCVHDWQRGFPNATVGTTKVLTNHGLSQPNCLLVAATRPARSHALCRGCWAGACQSRVHWLPRPKGPRGFHAFAATPTGAGGLRRWAAAWGGGCPVRSKPPTNAGLFKERPAGTAAPCNSFDASSASASLARCQADSSVLHTKAHRGESVRMIMLSAQPLARRPTTARLCSMAA